MHYKTCDLVIITNGQNVSVLLSGLYTKNIYRIKIWVKVTNAKNLSVQFYNLKNIYARHTLWSCLRRCLNIEMNPASIVEDRVRTRLCPPTNERTEGRTNIRTQKDARTYGQGETSIHHPFNFVEAGCNNLPWRWGTRAVLPVMAASGHTLLLGLIIIGTRQGSLRMQLMSAHHNIGHGMELRWLISIILML